MSNIRILCWETFDKFCNSVITPQNLINQAIRSVTLIDLFFHPLNENKAHLFIKGKKDTWNFCLWRYRKLTCCKCRLQRPRAVQLSTYIGQANNFTVLFPLRVGKLLVFACFYSAVIVVRHHAASIGGKRWQVHLITRMRLHLLYAGLFYLDIENIEKGDRSVYLKLV